MRAVPALLALVVAIGAAACGERPEPIAADLSVYPVSVRGADAVPITLDARPDKIAVLSAGAAELLAEMGAGDRLVGIPAEVSIPEAVGATELTRPSGLVDVDALAGLDADLVIASPATDAEDVGRALRRSPAPVYLTPDRSLGDVIRMTLELGLLVEEPVASREVAAVIRAQLADVDERLAETEPVTVFLDTGLLITVPEESLATDIVRRSGGQLVGTDTPGVPLDPCQLLELDPDVILTFSDAPEISTLDDGGEDCARKLALSDPLRVDGDLLTHAGPAAGEAVGQIARLLHPDAFE